MTDLQNVADIRLTDALVFDGDNEELIERDILILDGVIQKDSVSIPENIRTINAAGRVVTPGFIDAHFHAFAMSLDLMMNETRMMSYVALIGKQRLERALSRGFTSVRDVAGGDAGFHRGIQEGRIDAPRYYWSGAALSQTGGHGDPTDIDDTLCFHSGPGLEVVDGIEPIRKAVRERLRGGASVIKIMASGGVTSPVDPIMIPQYTHDEIEAACDEAARRGAYVAAHAYSSEAIQHAVKAGVRSVEHGNLMDRETATLMAELKAFLVPTLITYDAMNRRGRDFGMTEVGLAKNAEVLAQGRNAIEFAREAGVPIGFGSDLMGGLESEQLGGLRLQSEVTGTLETLRSVTSVNADLIRDQRIGRVQPGAFGDVLIFDENPFENQSALWNSETRTVIQAGRVIQTSQKH